MNRFRFFLEKRFGIIALLYCIAAGLLPWAGVRADDAGEAPIDEAIFSQWPYSRQLAFATQAMTNPALPGPTQGLLRTAIKSNSYNKLLRNNMAQALMGQSKPDPLLWREFLEMLDDPRQEKGWRVYCVQHMVSAAAGASPAHRKVIQEKLFSLARTQDPEFSARALLMLDAFEIKGFGKISERELDQLIEAKMSDTATSPAVHIAALGIIGKRGKPSHLPLVRSAARARSPEQRVAVATLGLIGVPSDKALLESLDPGGDELLEKAIRAAIWRIEQRFPAGRPTTGGSSEVPGRAAP